MQNFFLHILSPEHSVEVEKVAGSATYKQSKTV